MQQSAQLDVVKEIFSAVYGKATSYTNLIIAAGYVGFFTLWGSIKKDLPEWAILWSGAFILISLLIFIGFEIYKMISGSLHMKSMSTQLQNPSIHTLENIQREERKLALRSAKIWPFTLIPTVVFGMGAGLILLVSLLTNIIKPFVQ